MKKFVVLSLLLWFFSVRHDVMPGSDVKVLYIVGPFPSQSACEEERAEAIEFLNRRPGFVAYGCIEQKGA